MTLSADAVRRASKTAARRAYTAGLGVASSAVPGLRHDPLLRWFIILTMPNSGSTAVAGVLTTAPAAVGLTPKCEGEWLVPSLAHPTGRWDPDHRVSATKVRARWLRAAHATADRATPTVVVDKSPPNMVRRRWLEETVLWPMPVRFLVLVRDPYAVCASWRSSYGTSNRSLPRRPIDDADLCEMLGALYADRLRFLDDAVEHGIPLVRYEDWANDPTLLVGPVTTIEPLLCGFDPDAAVAVKGRSPAKPTDMNADHLSLLDERSTARITDGLRPAAASLRRYGYTLRA